MKQEMLYSFDIFDTLITRTTCTPYGIFLLMQQQLMSDPAFSDMDAYIRENFAVIRQRAESLARKEYLRGCVEEITLGQIYSAAAMTGRLTDKDSARLMELEKKTEIENAVGIRENIERVYTLRDEGRRVVLISNMYLDEETIRQMLFRADPVFHHIPIYVSSETGYAKWSAKRSGELFRYVRDKENAAYEQWMHIGDNEETDYNAAKELGIKAELFRPENLLPFEKDILTAHTNSAEAQLAIGTARNLRMNKVCANAESAGISFAGYVLFSYVYWLLEDSVRRGIKRLYFIARDGYIPMKIADIIIERLGLPIQMSYLYGSRRAWRMATYDGRYGELEELVSLETYNEIISLEQFASVLQVSVDDIIAFMPDAKGMDGFNALKVAELVKKLDADENFRKFLVEKNREKRKLLWEYLQAAVDPFETFAFVDMNGSGFSQRCLSGLMEECWGTVPTYFFKMDKVYEEESCIFYCFFPRYHEQDIILEAMTRTMQEQTLGYERQGNRIIPVLGGSEGTLLRAYGYEKYQEGVLAFVKEFVGKFYRNVKKGNLSLVDSYLSEFLEHPESEEFMYFADMPYSFSGRETEQVSFAPKPTMEQLRNVFLWNAGGEIKKYYNGACWEIGMLQCDDRLLRKKEYYRMNRGKIYKRLKKEDPSQFYPGREKLPYELLGNRVALYGAGKYGRQIYEDAKKHGIHVVQWLDGNAEILKNRGLPVTGTIDDIGMAPYDKIIVAVLSLYHAKVLCDELKKRDVPKTKIYCPALEVYSFGMLSERK